MHPLRRVLQTWHEGRSDAVMHIDGYRKWREGLGELGFRDYRGLRILDLGCGSRAQLALLFAADQAQVTALDVLPLALGVKRPLMWYRLARQTGLAAAGRALVRDVVHTARYWRVLSKVSGKSLPWRSIHVVQGDAARLPFDDGSFDVVVSSAVWEHLLDVEAATREVARVLRPRGVAVIQIALFTALQGGHHADWHSLAPDVERSVRPWDHLKPDRRPFPTYLNEWRESQYRDVFQRCLTVLRWEDDELRGSDFLTTELRSELVGYSERELLLSGVTIWASPPDNPIRASGGDRLTR